MSKLKLLEKIVTFEVVAAVWLIIFYFAGITLSKLWNDNNFSKLQALIRVCVPVTTNTSKNKVILRLDDVQAFAYKEETKRIVTDTISKNMPITLGVIPKNLSQDKDIISFIKSYDCNVEIALHGWDHQYVPKENSGIAEFENLNVNLASRRISLGLKMFQDVFAQHPTTFIPPSNAVSEGTISALGYAKIPILSSESGSLGGKYDVNASTEGFDSRNSDKRDTIISACERRFAQNQICIIMMHPQDFIEIEGDFSEGAYMKYLEFLDTINQKGWEVTTFDRTL